MDRRRYLAALGSTFTLGIAGCTGSDDDDENSDNSGEDGSADPGDSGGDANENGGDNGSDDGGENGTDGGSSNGSDSTGTDDSGPDDGSGGDGDDRSEGNGGGSSDRGDDSTDNGSDDGGEGSGDGGESGSSGGDGGGDNGDGDSSGGSGDDGGDSETEDRLTVEVVDVVDGDTMDIKYQDGSEDTVRLLGVDTPETQTGVSPDEFEGIPNSDSGRQCLRDYGDQASAFAQQKLAGETVQIRFDDQANRRGTFDRLLVYLIVDGENFNRLLLEKGYARVFDSQFGLSADFYSIESDRQDAGTGLWECRSVDDGDDNQETGTDSALTVTQIQADAPGDEYDNLDKESITFQNSGEEPIDLSGWTVADEAGFEYTIPTGFTLQPGDELTLRTGQGSDTDTDLYWGLERPVWNNGGDTIIVTDRSGTVIIEEEYN